jgi:hypothetical protein
MRSGRVRKAHAPLSEEDRAIPRTCCVGWLADGGLALELRSAGSQPTAFAKAKYVAPAPPHLSNWRLVNLVPIGKLSPIEMDFSRARFSIQPATCGAPVNKNSPSSSGKYDAAKALEELSVKLAPAHVSLWLRPDTASKGEQAE